MENKAIVSEIKEHLLNVFGIRLKGIVLFGSEARNESTTDSDIDVLVLLDEIRDLGADLRISLESVYPLSSKWEKRISIKPVAITQYEQLDCPLFRHAREEGIAAYQDRRA